MNLANPYYVNELQSDIRGIKTGWYGMEEDGNLSSGPFSCREDCIDKIDLLADGGMLFGLWRQQKQ